MSLRLLFSSHYYENKCFFVSFQTSSHQNGFSGQQNGKRSHIIQTYKYILLVTKEKEVNETRRCVHRWSPLCSGVLQSAMAQKVIAMGLDPSVVERITLEKIRTTGSGYSSVETLVEDCLNSTAPSNAATAQDQGTVLYSCYVDYTKQNLVSCGFNFNSCFSSRRRPTGETTEAAEGETVQNMYGQRHLCCFPSMWPSGKLQGVFSEAQRLSDLLWTHHSEDQDLYRLRESDFCQMSMLLFCYLYIVM